MRTLNTHRFPTFITQLCTTLVFLLTQQFAFAEDYYWYRQGNPSEIYASPSAGCTVYHPSFVSIQFYYEGTVANCRIPWQGSTVVESAPRFNRGGTGCTSPKTYNLATGICETPPEPCPAFGSEPRYMTISCSNQGGKYVHNDRVSFGLCEYVTQPGGFFKAYPNHDDPSKTYCVARFAPTGETLSPGEGVDDIPADNSALIPDEDDVDPACFKTGAYETCLDPKQPNCGTRGGNPFCFGEGDSCGEVNGQHICFPNGARKCSYADGSYECINPKTGEKITYDSPDHPKNGGNADGNSNNDEQKQGQVVVGGGAQGTDKGATNKSITDLQDALGDQLEAIKDALTEKTDLAGSGPETPNERGSLDVDEWDQKIEDAKLELANVTNQFGDLFQGITSVNLPGSGGQLYCDAFTAMGTTFEVCLSRYADQLAGIGLVILFLATLLAAYIIFIRD